MITQLSDELLADYSDDEIVAYIREETGAGENAPDAAIAHYLTALRMEPEVREAVFRLFRSAPLLCRECGAPSCIHGYSDE